jgi:hypothetical protein
MLAISKGAFTKALPGKSQANLTWGDDLKGPTATWRRGEVAGQHDEDPSERVRLQGGYL